MTAQQIIGVIMLIVFAAGWIALSTKDPAAKAALKGVVLGSIVSAYVGLAAWLIMGGAA